MKAGDLVRIGGVETEGFTDYLTVLEVRHITTLANGTDEVVSISKATTRTDQLSCMSFETRTTATTCGTNNNSKH